MDQVQLPGVDQKAPRSSTAYTKRNCRYVKETMRFLICILLSFFALDLYAQQLSGRIADAAYAQPLAKVLIENRTSGDATVSGPSGTYAIDVNKGDVLRFGLPGYITKELVIASEMTDQYQEVLLDKKNIATDTVAAGPGLSPYQKDSIKNRKIFGKKVEQRPAKFGLNKQGLPGRFGVLFNNPISAPYQRFSHKYKRLRAFQRRFKENEKRLFVYTRYTPALVQELTGLQGDTLAVFMNAYSMSYAFARTTTDLELKMWIRYNYREWIKNPVVFPPPIPKKTTDTGKNEK